MWNSNTIPYTLSLLKGCWEKAEYRARKHPLRSPLNEEHITSLIFDFLEDELQRATNCGSLAQAFANDLRAAFPHLMEQISLAEEIGHHLVMDCALHNKIQEQKSGGDFGLTLLRPEIHTSDHSSPIKFERRGLLCQAKRKLEGKQWRKLSIKQSEVLSDRTSYLALTLYSFSSTGSRSTLNQLQWQSCSGEDIRNVDGWLRKGAFPSPMSTLEMLQLIADNKLGTDSEEQIATHIALKERPHVDIRINWKDGNPPYNLHQLLVNVETQATVKVYA